MASEQNKIQADDGCMLRQCIVPQYTENQKSPAPPVSDLRPSEDVEISMEDLTLEDNQDVSDGMDRNGDFAKAFYDAITKMNVEQAKQLMELKPELVHYHDDKKRTALHLAVLFDHLRLVRLLLRHGADPYQQDREGNTPLHLACESDCDPVIVSLLLDNRHLERYNDLYNDDGRNCLIMAALKNNMETVKMLINVGLDINCQELSEGKTLFHHAVERCDRELLSIVLHCADLVDIENYRRDKAVEIAYNDNATAWDEIHQMKPDLTDSYQIEIEMSMDSD